MDVSSVQPAVSGLRAVSGNCLLTTTTLNPPCACLVPTHCSFLSHLVKYLMLRTRRITVKQPGEQQGLRRT